MRCDVLVTHIVPQLFDATNGLLGGAERYALELARHMAERVPTRLVTFGRTMGRRTVGKLEIRIIRPAFRVQGHASNPFSIRALAFPWSSDVVHVHQSHLLLSEVLAGIGSLVGRPVFTTDLGGGGLGLSRLLNAQDWYAGHLHISQYSRVVFGHSDNPRARVILGGVDPDQFRPGPGGGGVLYVGRILPHKGIDVLIRAMPDDWPLTIVGWSQHTEYSRLLASLAAGKRVTFSGALSGETLAAAYAAADVIVLPSVYRDCYGATTEVPELLGQALLEGMVAGLPGVATRVASLPELIDDRHTGFLVEPNDPGSLRTALDALRSDPATAHAMGRAARSLVLERFSWTATVDRCLLAYRELSHGGTS